MLRAIVVAFVGKHEMSRFGRFRFDLAIGSACMQQGIRQSQSSSQGMNAVQCGEQVVDDWFGL